MDNKEDFIIESEIENINSNDDFFNNDLLQSDKDVNSNNNNSNGLEQIIHIGNVDEINKGDGDNVGEDTYQLRHQYNNKYFDANFVDLEQKIVLLENENEQLKEELKTKNGNSNEMKLNQKILSLEQENIKLNNELNEIKKKLIKFENSEKIDKNLENKIDEYEITISKLEFDRKNLFKKIENLQKEHINEIKNLNEYKNNELSVYQRALENYKNVIENQEFDKLLIELERKDIIIKDLQKKLKNNNISDQIKKLINEKNILIKINQNLKIGIKKVNEQINQANILLVSKTNNYNNVLNIYNNKLNEYKKKIILLKRKICELHSIINKLKHENKFLDKQERPRPRHSLGKKIIGNALIKTPKIKKLRKKQFFDNNSNKNDFINCSIKDNKSQKNFKVTPPFSDIMKTNYTKFDMDQKNLSEDYNIFHNLNESV